MHQESTVGGSQVGELDRQLGELQNAVSQHLLFPVANVTTFFDHLRVLVNVLAARDHITRAHMLKVKDPAVLVVAVSKSKVDARAVLGGGPHEVTHDARYVKGKLPLRLLCHFLITWMTCLWPTAGVNHLCVFCPLYQLRGHCLCVRVPLWL